MRRRTMKMRKNASPWITVLPSNPGHTGRHGTVIPEPGRCGMSVPSSMRGAGVWPIGTGTCQFSCRMRWRAHRKGNPMVISCQNRDTSGYAKVETKPLGVCFARTTQVVELCPSSAICPTNGAGQSGAGSGHNPTGDERMFAGRVRAGRNMPHARMYAEAAPRTPNTTMNATAIDARCPRVNDGVEGTAEGINARLAGVHAPVVLSVSKPHVHSAAD